MACNSNNGGYSGCKRTVCNFNAAQTICANLKYDGRNWRLPSMRELAAFDSYSTNKGSTGLMLCTHTGSGAAKCNYNSSCPGSIYNYCDAYDVWSGTMGTGYNNEYIFYYGQANGACYLNGDNRRCARSVRCVTEFTDE